MEIRCSRCLKRDTCDHVDWTIDEDGATLVAEKIEGCPDFDLDPEFYMHAMADCVLDSDPDEYLDVRVGETEPQVGYEDGHTCMTYSVYITTESNLNAEDATDRIRDIQHELQELNDEVMKIQDAEWTVYFIYAQESNPEVPDFLPEDIGGSNIMVEDVKEQDKSLKDFQFPGGIHKVEGDDWLAPSPCPICNTPMRRTCPNCGYEWEDRDGT